MSSALKGRLKRSGRCYNDASKKIKFTPPLKCSTPQRKLTNECEYVKPSRLFHDKKINKDLNTNKKLFIQNDNKVVTEILDHKTDLKIIKSKIIVDKEPELEINTNIDKLTDDEIKENTIKLKKKISNNKEIIRKLKLIKTYQKKHSIEELNKLKQKWKNASQQALEYLHDNNKDNSSILQIIKYFNIDTSMVGYDDEEEDFI